MSNDTTIARFADALFVAVKGYVERHAARLLDDRLAKLDPPRGDKGDKGDKGEKGDKGDRGLSGIDGTAGRDAAQLEILSSISFERSYPRGTYASHEGGLWRSARTTDPVDGEATPEAVQEAGWHCIVEGRAAVSIERRGDREIVVKDRSCTGRVTESVFEFPFMVYRKLYEEGTAYRVGDTVTFGGALWHCDVANTKRKPGELGSEDWHMVVRKGDRGKDGRDATPRGPRPPVKV